MESEMMKLRTSLRFSSLAFFFGLTSGVGAMAGL